MANNKNKEFNLEHFVDSIVHEMDKSRESLFIKGMNSPLSYAVKDLSLDLQVFPKYDGDEVKFVAAQNGERGASKISLTLGSITDRQIRETSRAPIIDTDDKPIEEIKSIDNDTKKQLKRLGVRSAKDVEKIQNKNIKVNKGGQTIDFKKLASVLNKTKRQETPPKINGIQFGKVKNHNVLAIKGENLLLNESFSSEAEINQQKTKVISASKDHLLLLVDPSIQLGSRNAIKVKVDEDTNIEFTLKNKTNEQFR